MQPWGFSPPFSATRPNTPTTSVAQTFLSVRRSPHSLQIPVLPNPPTSNNLFPQQNENPKIFIRRIFLTFALASTASAQSPRTVAITVDDLPYAGPLLNLPNYSADEINNRLLAAFAKHHVPVTGFVIEQSVGEKLDRTTGTRVLQHWIANGLDLGNHTYSHPDFNNRSIDQIKEEITKGEATFATLMKAAGRKPEYFRYPMLHTGDTKEKHDAIAAFIAQRGYHNAFCTVESSDYLFNVAYVKMLEK